LLLWQFRQQPQTASVVGANGAMHLRVEIIQPLEAEHSATMMSQSNVAGMPIAKTSLLLRLLLLLQLLLDHQFLHPRLILHTRQLHQPHQVLVAWNFWDTWRIGDQTSSGGMRTCPAIA